MNVMTSGFSNTRIQRVSRAMQRAVDSGEISGALALIEEAATYGLNASDCRIASVLSGSHARASFALLKIVEKEEPRGALAMTNAYASGAKCPHKLLNASVTNFVGSPHSASNSLVG